MKSTITIHFRLLILILTCSSIPLYANYTQKQIDSILKAENYDLYKNPDKVIAKAEKIIQKNEISTDNKIQFLILISTAYSSKRDYKKSLYYATQALGLLPKVKDDFFLR